MSESADSLLIKAQRLSAIARAKKENESDAQAEGQIATALTKLKTQLVYLESAVQSYQKLRAARIAIASPPDLKTPAGALQSQVANIGRPSPQFLTKRSGDLVRNIADLQSAVDKAWSAWADGQIDALHGDKLTGHGPRVTKIQEEVFDLRAKAKQKFSSTEFTLFTLAISRVRDQIEDLQTPTDLEKVVARIKHGSLTLADLTDSEVTALRADPEISGTISLGLV